MGFLLLDGAILNTSLPCRAQSLAVPPDAALALVAAAADRELRKRCATRSSTVNGGV